MKRIIIAVACLFSVCMLTACGASDTVTVIETSPETPATQARTEAPTSGLIEMTEEHVPETQKPTAAPVVTQPPQENNSRWKELYIAQVQSLDSSVYAGFSLIMVDGDDIPELYAQPAAHVVMGYLYWVYNDTLCSQGLDMNGMSYIERQNLFLSYGGWTGKGYDQVMTISGSSAKTLQSGEYTDVGGEQTYSWNGVSMSASQYEAAKNAAYDSSKATKPGNLYSYDEIQTAIRNY